MLVFPVVLAARLVRHLVRDGRGERSNGRAGRSCCSATSLAAPAVSATIVILCVVSASAALAMAIAVAYARGRRLERRMAAELDARWAALAERDAGDAARRKLLSWRIAELQTLVEQLLAERQATLQSTPRLFLVPESPGVTRQQ